MDFQHSGDCKTAAAKFARSRGYDVHHDIHGWYVIAPDEDEPASGYSLGFDGRAHFASCVDAWDQAQHEAFAHT